MTNEAATDRATRKMKRLSVAVWILAILLCGTLLVSFVVPAHSVDRDEPIFSLVAREAGSDFHRYCTRHIREVGFDPEMR